MLRSAPEDALEPFPREVIATPHSIYSEINHKLKPLSKVILGLTCTAMSTNTFIIISSNIGCQ